MGVGVLILGNSGSGKSTSLRNFTNDEMGLFNITGKPLPFRNNIVACSGEAANYGLITETIRTTNKKVVVVDDAGYLIQFENFARAKETGYTKFTEMAQHFESLLKASQEAKPDTITYIMAHQETDEQGKVSTQVIGKMLKEKFNIEGMYTILLGATKNEDGYWFITNTKDPNLPYKTPMDMFKDELIPNDLKAVDSVIREYYNLAPLNGKAKTAPASKAQEPKGA